MTRGTIAAPHARRGWKRIAWFGALAFAICFEGVGRKMFPDVPSPVFYYAKDVVLVAGVWLFGVSARQFHTARGLLRGFVPIIILAFVWTVAQVFNPAQQSLLLGLLGLRGYWLWWLAPLLIATVLENARERERATQVLAGIAIAVAAFAVLQFASPASSAINSYALYGGETVLDVATIASTGRARVSSTFSYITGFTDFTVLLPPLLFGVGTDAQGRSRNLVSLLAAAACLAVIPLSGSRGPLLLAAVGVLALAAYGGILSRRGGLRLTMAIAIAAAIAFISIPDAVQGVTERFAGDDTNDRLNEIAEILPPVALTRLEYPPMGEGTGMQQNARIAFGISSPWATESETSRLLAEQGGIGYLLVWASKLGLAVALIRAARRLKRAQRTGIAGTAVAFAGYAIIGNSAFDHVWQALFFVGGGIVLAAASDAAAARASPRVLRGAPPKPVQAGT